MKFIAVTPSARQVSQKLDAEKRSCTTALAPSSIIAGSTVVYLALMWYSGNAVKNTSSSPYSITLIVDEASWKFALCESTAAFDGPVVPDVNRSTAVSSGTTSTAGRAASAVSSSAKRVALRRRLLSDYDHVT